MFRPVDFSHLSKFNSDTSAKLIDMIENQAKADIQEESARPKSRTFAPSSLRCRRKSWFRIRGSQPDSLPNPDLTLDFTAKLGTYIHTLIQEKLSKALVEDWIPVKQYLAENPIPYTYSIKESGYETQICIENPPLKFACDGIIRLNGKLYLLEIKTSEYSSWDSLVEAKPHHMDQIKAYSTILNIPNVLTLYVDRQYGGLKSFEYAISIGEMNEILNIFEYVSDCAEKNLAPERLPESDYMCRNCEYSKKCREW